MQRSILAFLALIAAGSAFTTPRRVMTSHFTALHAATGSAADKVDDYEEPGRNPDRPELPELKNDFDWDAKFGADDDWSTENVPGKVVLNEIALAKQVTELDRLEETWRKQRIRKEYERERLLGFTEQAETYNGRFAMFFLVVGLLTEYWTGISLPGQVEEMLRVGGVIGFEG